MPRKGFGLNKEGFTKEMSEYIESDYGELYLTQRRAKEFSNIVQKHIHNMFFELREHKIIPSHLMLEKMTVRELDDYNAIQQHQF